MGGGLGMTAERLIGFVVWTGWVACLASIFLVIAMPGVAGMAVMQWSPWLFGLAVVGIPHGVLLDHRIGAELEAGRLRKSGIRTRWRFYAAYLTAALAVVALWFVSPVAASVGFLGVAALHFGQGDVYWSGRFGLAARAGSVGYRASLLLARSSLPIAAPLLAFPGVLSGAVSTIAARLFGREGWSIPPSVMGWGLIGLGGVVVLQVGWALCLGWSGDGATRRAAAVDIAETGLLAGLFGIVPPILALGVYFNAWHSLRHIARLLLISGSTRPLVDAGRLAAAFGAFTVRPCR